jgi:acetoin utilization protein AcuB
MKVKSWIHRHPITINRTALLQDAVQLMKSHNIRHLPVVDDDGELVGFVTESDLRQFSFPSMIEEIPVHQVMMTNPRTIDANASIEEAARLIHDKKIGGLPVMENGALVGVITASDLLSAFIEVMGLLKSTTRIDVLVSEEHGGIELVTKIIKSHNCEIVNVATDSKEGKKKVYYFRLEHCEAKILVSDLEAAGHQVLSVME